ncbi:Uncharacterised protein [Mycobacteroides abscessus subsp. abscessus]|uniref:hypothetical protein n=1 Tax=Mycobacteroides abscessus TaxID=36809 RepID=UPI0009259857|nr:hypothetical protein [Mycobacteroides abscessus]SHT13476.1 Uncharacterised protein [Mycobacteroides abscessus subsp. abscessus]SIA20397.1 Uncharacterised protein [Mycobacteroides abscessus subsp. abscessus]SID50416.1 Uncharacterised protein [Mycobacteroides abscessus subsp. abscessus]SIF19076.1 Uncharacterised protein [Mycobacteroides abscessus subsp. abscessus]SII24170.1 Uncharacterised protein [Mycobacteroides abscessus subsp. abscessus]
MTETPKPTRELIAKMRDAAGALQDATRIHFGDLNPGRASQTNWSPVYLRRVADQWESDLDADDALTEQLAQCIAGFLTNSQQYEKLARERANPIARLVLANFDVKPKGAMG